MCLSHMPYIDLVFCSSCMVPDHTSPVVHVANLSLVLTRMKHAPTHRRSVDDQRQTGLIVGLDHIILHPSRQPWSRGERIRSSSYIATSACWVHNTSMRSIRSILTHGGPTHRSLTNTGEGYNLTGADLPTPLPNHFNRWSYTFHLIAPSGLRLSIQILPTKIKREQIINFTSGTSPLGFYRSLSPKHSMR
jgi:hypothetical protein